MIEAVFFDLYETLITELDPRAPERRLYWATWVLDCWPASKRTLGGRELAAQYSALSSIDEVVGIVEASRMLEYD